MFGSIELPQSSMSVALNQNGKSGSFCPATTELTVRDQVHVSFFILVHCLCVMSHVGDFLSHVGPIFWKLDTSLCVIFPFPTQSVIQLSVNGLLARCQIYHTYIYCSTLSFVFFLPLACMHLWNARRILARKILR